MSYEDPFTDAPSWCRKSLSQGSSETGKEYRKVIVLDNPTLQWVNPINDEEVSFGGMQSPQIKTPNQRDSEIEDTVFKAQPDETPFKDAVGPKESDQQKDDDSDGEVPEELEGTAAGSQVKDTMNSLLDAERQSSQGVLSAAFEYGANRSRQASTRRNQFNDADSSVMRVNEKFQKFFIQDLTEETKTQILAADHVLIPIVTGFENTKNSLDTKRQVFLVHLIVKTMEVTVVTSDAFGEADLESSSADGDNSDEVGNEDGNETVTPVNNPLMQQYSQV